jgi:hypothetical protein
MNPLLTIFTFLILVTPSLVLGADNVTQDGIYTGGGLIPCGQTADNPCNSCHLVILANTIVKWVIGITFLIFAGMGVYTGVRMVTSGGNAHAKEDAKEMFTNLIIGLLIILGAWLMIDTLLRFVLKGGENGEIDGYGPWSQVKCVEEVRSGTTKMTIEEDEFNPAAFVQGGSSVNQVPAGQMTSLKSAGVVVANWPGITGPKRTDVVHPDVATATLWMQNEGKRLYGKNPFQVTAAYTEGVGHSANSQHYRGTAVDLQPINGVTFDQIIQLCKAAKFTYVNDERKANHIHCDMR